MKKLSFILFLTVCFLQMQGQDRTMYWIHGFAGNNSAWFPVTRAVQETGLVSGFPARRATCIRTPYSSPGNATGVIDLETAASSLQQVFQDNGANNPGRTENAIAVAHSQGGLVTRWATDNVIPSVGHGKYFKGLVTFGTPHLGARIINAQNIKVTNGQSELDVFLNEGCNKLGGAVLKDNLSKFSGLTNLFGNSLLVNQSVTGIAAAICDNLFSKDARQTPASQSKFLQKKIMGAPAGFDGTRGISDDPCLADYAIGASALNQLNNMPLTPDIVRVNFYGSELDEGIFFRNMHYFFKPPVRNPIFGASDIDENKTVATFNQLAKDLTNSAFQKRHEANAVQCGNWWWLGWATNLSALYCLKQENKANTLRNEAKRLEVGAEWITKADDQWLGLIGAKQVAVTPTKQCVCDVGLSPYSANRSCTSSEIRRGCEEELIFEKHIRREDHDGVVVKSSAMGMRGSIPITDVYARLEGSQHIQMQNDQRIKEKLLLLFEGRIDSFLLTTPK